MLAADTDPAYIGKNSRRRFMAEYAQGQTATRPGLHVYILPAFTQAREAADLSWRMQS